MSMISDHFPHLFQFFGSYFHQDFDLEGDDWEDLVKSFLQHESRDRALAVSNELRQLLAMKLEDERLSEMLLRDLGSYYDPGPDGLSSTNWLRAMIRYINESLNTDFTD